MSLWIYRACHRLQRHSHKFTVTLLHPAQSRQTPSTIDLGLPSYESSGAIRCMRHGGYYRGLQLRHGHWTTYNHDLLHMILRTQKSNKDRRPGKHRQRERRHNKLIPKRAVFNIASSSRCRPHFQGKLCVIGNSDKAAPMSWAALWALWDLSPTP